MVGIINLTLSQISPDVNFEAHFDSVRYLLTIVFKLYFPFDVIMMIMIIKQVYFQIGILNTGM